MKIHARRWKEKILIYCYLAGGLLAATVAVATTRGSQGYAVPLAVELPCRQTARRHRGCRHDARLAGLTPSRWRLSYLADGMLCLCAGGYGWRPRDNLKSLGGGLCPHPAYGRSSPTYARNCGGSAFYEVLMSPSSGGGFELPRHSSGDGWRLELRRVYYSAAALTPRLTARGGSRASRAGTPAPLAPLGRGPRPFPRSPAPYGRAPPNVGATGRAVAGYARPFFFGYARLFTSGPGVFQIATSSVRLPSFGRTI